MLKAVFNNGLAGARYSVFAQTARFGNSYQNSTLESSLKNKNDDAVKVSLSKQAKEASKAEPVEKQEGYVTGALKQIAGITKRIAELKTSLQNSAMSEEQRGATQAEISNLSNEYSAVTNSDQYKELMNVIDSVNQGIQSGQDPRNYYKTLASQRGLLGDDILGIIQHGATFNLGALSSSLNTIAGADLSNVLEDGSVLDTVSSAVRDASKALSGPDVEEGQSQSVVPTIQKTLPNQINPRIMTFVGPDDVALSLRSFSTEDMLTAALNGMDIGPISTLTLAINPDKDGKDHDNSNPEVEY